MTDMSVKGSTFCDRYFSALTRLDMGMLIWQVPTGQGQAANPGASRGRSGYGLVQR